jgi:hypothetical protein
MTPTEAASPPLIPLDPRRARLRARPAGLKGSLRDGPLMPTLVVKPLLVGLDGQGKSA